MADSKSAQWSTLLSYSSGITLGGQTSSEDYAVGLTKSLPSGTGGASFLGSAYFNDYARTTGTVDYSGNLELDFSGFPHQRPDGTTTTKVFKHINAFMFFSAVTGVNDYFTINATGDNAFTNMFNGESGNLKVNPFSTFEHLSYYGTQVTHDNRMIGISNPLATGVPYKCMVVGYNESTGR
tara:strand:- start:280 stop:822 length:543 start_codon:yes stop_codon:yes gene_type:complete